MGGRFRLLGSSVLVAVSAGFLLYWAFRIAGAEVRPLLCIGFSLLFYSVYTLDRVLGGKEDELNREGVSIKERRVAVFFVVLCFAGSAFILIREEVTIMSAIYPFIVGFLYGHGLKLGDRVFRLKGGMGVKNAVVAATWAGSAAFFISPWIRVGGLGVLFVFIFGKVFMGSVIYDFGDLEGDAAVGIETIPAVLGVKKSVWLILGVHVLFHLTFFAMTVSGVLEFPFSLLLLSWSIGSFAILVFRYSEFLRDLTVDGEWLLFTLIEIRSLVGSTVL